MNTTHMSSLLGLVVGLLLSACDDSEMSVADTALPEDAQTDVSPDLELRFEIVAPQHVAHGDRFPILVRAFDAQGQPSRTDGWITLSSGTAVLDNPRVYLRRGLGVNSTTVQATGDFELEVEGDTATGSPRAISLLADPSPRTLQGSLSGGDLIWNAGERIAISDDVVVPEGETLTIEAGVRVELAASTNLDVQGMLEVRGTQDAPVIFAALDDTGWGGLTVSTSARLDHTYLLEGGADSDRNFGHSNSQAVVFAHPGASLELYDSAILDCPGKGIGAEQGEVTLEGVVVTRTDTGGELVDSVATLTSVQFMDFPTLEPPIVDDDNDGIYFKGVLLDGQGNPRYSTIRDSVFISGADDGIDHNGAFLRIENTWIEGFAHEGIAGSNGGHLHVEDTLITACEQGLEAGYGDPRVTANHVVLIYNDVGARYGDSYDWDYQGTLEIQNAIIAFNSKHDVWNFLFSTNAPSEGVVTVRHSLISQPIRDGDSGAGVVIGEPQFTKTFLLLPDSPGIGTAQDGSDPGLVTPR